MASFGTYSDMKPSEWPWQPAATNASTTPPSRGMLGSAVPSVEALGATTASPMQSPDSTGMSAMDSFQVPTSVGGPEYFAGQRQDGAKQYVILMVGLPARGKTFMAQKLCRLLNWQGVTSECYNIQTAWKEAIAAPTTVELYESLHQADSKEREAYRQVLQSFAHKATQFFGKGGSIVFLNDDFTSKGLRDEATQLFSSLGAGLFCIEVLRESQKNTTFDNLKVKDPSEYNPSKMDADKAAEDFRKRVAFMEEHYQTLGEDDSYIKVLNSNDLKIHRVQGYLPSRVASYLLNLSQVKVAHPIYFSRHGQSMYNLEDRLGGNPELTEKGHQDAQWLKVFIGSLKRDEAEAQPENDMQIWTSQLTRAIQTADPGGKEYNIPMLRWSSLNEIHAGVCENMTYGEVKEEYPLIHRFRGENKYTFRYPEGESYQDLVARVEPVIMELENADRVVVVVAHQAVLRVLLAYFGGNSADSSVNVEVSHRTVWRCTYSSTGITAVDLLRLGPDVCDKVAGNMAPPHSPGDCPARF